MLQWVSIRSVGPFHLFIRPKAQNKKKLFKVFLPRGYTILRCALNLFYSISRGHSIFFFTLLKSLNRLIHSRYFVGKDFSWLVSIPFDFSFDYVKWNNGSVGCWWQWRHEELHICESMSFENWTPTGIVVNLKKNQIALRLDWHKSISWLNVFTLYLIFPFFSRLFRSLRQPIFFSFFVVMEFH